MRFKVVLYPSDEGVAVSAPELAGLLVPGSDQGGSPGEYRYRNPRVPRVRDRARPRGGGSRDRDHGLAMPKLPDVNHLDAVRALRLAGFRVSRQGKQIIMTDGTRKVVLPSHAPGSPDGSWLLARIGERAARPGSFGRAVTMFDFRCQFFNHPGREILSVCHSELVIGGVEQPVAEAGAVGLHHERRQGAAFQLEDAKAPGAGRQDLGVTVRVIIGHRPELVVGGVEQPLAKMRPVRGHHRGYHGGARSFQDAQSPGAGDDDFGTAVFVQVTSGVTAAGARHRETCCSRSRQGFRRIADRRRHRCHWPGPMSRPT